MQRTLLAVHAHPDDESITMGGTLARYSAEGVRTVVVTCTSGDLGEVLVQNERGESVASLRDRELRSACDVLGVSRLVQLGYGDSGMPGDPLNHRQGAFWAADLGEAASRLQEVIDEEHPDVIATYDDTGGYGHPDHLKSHLVTVEAVRRLGWQPRLFFVRFPLSWSREFVTALRAEGILTPGSAPSGADAGPDVHEIGVPDALVTTRIDVRSYVAIKRRALQCYASQLPPEHWLSRMPDALAGRFWAEEVYSLDGPAPPPPTDLFCEP